MLIDLNLRARCWREAAAIFRNARAIRPDAAELGAGLAERLIEAVQPHEALDVVEAAESFASDAHTRFRLLVVSGRALDALDLEEAAISSFNRAGMIEPDDPFVLERLTFYDQENGLWPQCRPRLLELHRIRAAGLPSTLAEGLEALWDQARKVRSVDARVEAAWELADQKAWDWEEWRAAVVWGGMAYHFLHTWWRWAPERAGEILDLLDPPDLTPIRRALEDGRGCILAGAHIGAPSAGVEFLQRSDLPFSRVGFAGHERAIDGGRESVVTLMPNRVANARAVVNRLKAGDLLGWMIDSPSGATRTVTCLGRSLKLAAAAPRLAGRYAGASFWFQPLWRGDRIVIDIERLPDPTDGEAEEAWTRRWYDAVVRKLGPILTGDPRNLVCNDGVWRTSTSYGLDVGAPRALLAGAVSRPMEGGAPPARPVSLMSEASEIGNSSGAGGPAPESANGSPSIPQPTRIAMLGIAAGRDEAMAFGREVGAIFEREGAGRTVGFEYKNNEFAHCFADYIDTGDEQYREQARILVRECPHDCIVGSGYAPWLPVFAECCGPDLCLVQIGRLDRDRDIASLVKDCGMFPSDYGSYSDEPGTSWRRMTAFHFGELSREAWFDRSLASRMTWFFDKTHQLVDTHAPMFRNVCGSEQEMLDIASIQALAEKVVSASNPTVLSI